MADTDRPIVAASTAWPRVAVRDDVSVETVAELHRHVVARNAILDMLETLGIIDCLHNFWLERLGIVAAVESFARCAEALASAIGYDSTISMMRASTGDSIPCRIEIAPEQDEWIDAKVSEMNSAIRSLDEALEKVRANPERLVDHADAVLADYGIAWPWLTLTVVSMFMLFLRNRSLGEMCHVEYRIRSPAEAPPAFSFIPQPGESPSEIVRRSASEYRKYVRRVRTGSSLPAGRRGKNQNETVVKYTGWLVFRRVGELSISEIARMEFSVDDSPRDRRSDVRRGITTAERLLSLSPYS